MILQVRLARLISYLERKMRIEFYGKNMDFALTISTDKEHETLLELERSLNKRLTVKL